jgi:acetyl-CoA acetyltransferase
MIQEHFEDSTVISGIGRSQSGRRLGRTAMDLTLESIRLAVSDAGLSMSDIDGISTFPGFMAEPPGFSGPGLRYVQDALRLKVNWYNGAEETPSQMGSLINAAMAISAGLVSHVLCYRTVLESTTQGEQRRNAMMTGFQSGRVSDFQQWHTPFGAPSAINWVALWASRHFHEFGTTREQLAQIALNARKNAARNPEAIFKSELTLADYLDSRMISSPLCLYDCDIPADGSTAFVLSRADRTDELSSTCIRIDAIGCASHTRPSWDQIDGTTGGSMYEAAKMMWNRTDLKQSDVDVAEIYDGFSYLTLAWLEALGFCERGEGGSFIEDGHRIALDGELPLATGGGQLSAGRLHGYTHIYEACLQLRGLGGQRQVDPTPKVALVSNGGGPSTASMLLHVDE